MEGLQERLCLKSPFHEVSCCDFMALMYMELLILSDFRMPDIFPGLYRHNAVHEQSKHLCITQASKEINHLLTANGRNRISTTLIGKGFAISYASLAVF